MDFDKETELPRDACARDGSDEALELTSPAPGRIVAVHRCAHLNCCSTLAVELSYTPPATLTLGETEEEPLCRCEGNFHPTFEIEGLTPGTWTVHLGDLSASIEVE